MTGFNPSIGAQAPGLCCEVIIRSYHLLRKLCLAAADHFCAIQTSALHGSGSDLSFVGAHRAKVVASSGSLPLSLSTVLLRSERKGTEGVGRYY